MDSLKKTHGQRQKKKKNEGIERKIHIQFKQKKNKNVHLDDVFNIDNILSQRKLNQIGFLKALY